MAPTKIDYLYQYAKRTFVLMKWNDNEFEYISQSCSSPSSETQSKRAGKYGTKKSKERLLSPFFTFLRAILFARLDFPSPPLSAPGSPRMVDPPKTPLSVNRRKRVFIDFPFSLEQ